jgi:hypothetical protein
LTCSFAARTASERRGTQDRLVEAGDPDYMPREPLQRGTEPGFDPSIYNMHAAQPRQPVHRPIFFIFLRMLADAPLTSESGRVLQPHSNPVQEKHHGNSATNNRWENRVL